MNELRCRQALYEDGLPAPRTCRLCGLGPCTRVKVQHESPRAEHVPNRLFGATINHEGDAV